MANVAVIALLFPEENEERKEICMRITRKRLKDVSDQFALPENQFRSLYRVGHLKFGI